MFPFIYPNETFSVKESNGRSHRQTEKSKRQCSGDGDMLGIEQLFAQKQRACPIVSDRLTTMLNGHDTVSVNG